MSTRVNILHRRDIVRDRMKFVVNLGEATACHLHETSM